jgi:two-component system NarL family sensor kinase
MQRLVRFGVPAALAVGTLSAAAAVVLVVRLPAGWFDIVLAATAVVFLPTGLVGAAIVRANQRNGAGWIMLLAGAALPLTVVCQVVADAAFASGDADVPAPTSFALAAGIVGVLGVPLVGTLGLLLFPDGHLPPGRGRRLATICIAELVALAVWALGSSTLLGTRAANVDSPLALPGADLLVLAILAMTPLTAITARTLLRRADVAPTDELRRALRLAAYAAFTIPLAYLACIVVGFSGGATQTVGLLENCAAIAIGLASWVGIVRYGLFDLRSVVSRSLVYATLTAIVVAIYAVVSTVLERAFSGALPAAVAAAAAAIAVLPLRDRLQRRADRLVFGLRNDPGAAFGLLGVRLDAAAAPEDVLPLAVRTVAEALRLRYVTIEIEGAELACFGERVTGPCLEVDLPFAGQSIGRLAAQANDPHEPFGRAHRALLESLATQLGLAARAVALSHAERESRERLAVVREDERLRLRRDLHDGLGTTLAGIALGIDAARRSLPAEAAASAGERLATLRMEAEAAVGEIRRIAYNLRPPILDDMGLFLALRDQALRMDRATVSAQPDLPPLVPAVEVAAYRIASEAMTNAARHAPDATLDVRICVNGRTLELEIADDGAGLPGEFRPGIGLTSMRERAAELGGTLSVTAHHPRGTLVRAQLPLEPVVL